MRLYFPVCFAPQRTDTGTSPKTCSCSVFFFAWELSQPFCYSNKFCTISLKIHIAHDRQVYRLSRYFLKTYFHLMFHGDLNYQNLFRIRLWPMPKWYRAASLNCLPSLGFLLALAKHGINSTEVNGNQISTQASFCPSSQEKQINPGLRLQVFSCSFEMCSIMILEWSRHTDVTDSNMCCRPWQKWARS